MSPKKDFICCSDEELLYMVAQNDKNALAILYDRYSLALYLYIKRIVLTHASGVQAQNDTQKILIDVFSSIASNSPPIPPLPFTLEDHLFASAYNKAIDYVCAIGDSTDAELHSSRSSGL